MNALDEDQQIRAARARTDAAQAAFKELVPNGNRLPAPPDSIFSLDVEPLPQELAAHYIFQRKYGQKIQEDTIAALIDRYRTSGSKQDLDQIILICEHLIYNYHQGEA
jgi:hypothetical protein